MVGGRAKTKDEKKIETASFKNYRVLKKSFVKFLISQVNFYSIILIPNDCLVIKSRIFSFCRFDPLPPHNIYTILLVAKTFLFV